MKNLGYNINKPPLIEALPSLENMPDYLKDEINRYKERQESLRSILENLPHSEGQTKDKKEDTSMKLVISKADILTLEGKYFKALKLYNRVLEIDDDNTEALYKKAFVYYKMGKYEIRYEPSMKLWRLILMMLMYGILKEMFFMTGKNMTML